MISIHCLKLFNNYYKITTCNKNDTTPENSWSVQKLSADGKRCVLFLHHTTAVYFVIFGFEREDIVNLKSLFVDGLIAQLESHIQLNETEKTQIINSIDEIEFYDISNNKNVNNLVNNVISTIKGLSLLNYGESNPLTIEALYNEQERYFDENNCEKLKNILLDKTY